MRKEKALSWSEFMQGDEVAKDRKQIRAGRQRKGLQLLIGLMSGFAAVRYHQEILQWFK